MSTPPPPPSDPSRPDPATGGYPLVSPLFPEDPPRLGDFWIDARLGATASGVAFVGHDDHDVPAMVIMLAEGAAEDAAARDRFAGVINKLHIDTVIARGGHGQQTGRLGRKFRSEDDDPTAPDARQVAPWAALAYDGSPQAAAEAQRILAEVELSALPPKGQPSGPDYSHYWINRVRPGLARVWPLPWPGRYDRAGWWTIFISWLLMLLIAALAVLIAILIFRNQPPQAPPPPVEQTMTPPPSASPPPSGSPSPSSGSPPPSSGSPSPESASPSPQSGEPTPSESPSPSDSGSPAPPSSTPSMTGSPSGSPSPSGSQSGGGEPSPSESGPAGGSSPKSRL